MRNLLVIGSLNMDMMIHADKLPLLGETVMGKLHAYIPGGKGANQAYAASRLGAGVAMLGMVGRDGYGDALIKSLESCGTDTSLLRRSHAPTGLAVICVDKLANNTIVVISGANMHTDVNYIRNNSDAIMNSKVIMLQMEIPYDAVYEAIKIAHENGQKIVLNPAPAPKDIPQEVLRMVDYLTPNETELETLTGIPVCDEASAVKAGRMLISRGVKHVVATLGSQGALFISDGIEKLFPARKVKAVDTTAAGDTFNAAFAMEIANNKSIDEAIRFANTAAAISVTRNGAQTSIPTRDEVLMLMREDLLS